MRGVMAFLVWLFNLWTWFRAFIMVHWSKMPPLEQGRVDSSVGVEQLRSNEGQHESTLAAILSSLPEDTEVLTYARLGNGFQLTAWVGETSIDFSIDDATHAEFLATIGSSNIKCCSEILVQSSALNFDLKQLEGIMGALVSNNNFKSVSLDCCGCFELEMAECISKLLSRNKAIEHLEVRWMMSKEVGKEGAKLLANGLRENRILKSLHFYNTYGITDDETIEVLMKPLKDNDSALQYLCFSLLTDVGLAHLGVMLSTNTSLKKLVVDDIETNEVCMGGITSVSKALCINQSLETLTYVANSSMELKMLLEPFMPMNNNPQANTTLTSLSIERSSFGEEGMQILTRLIHANTSLLKLKLDQVFNLLDQKIDVVENVVLIMEALKTNESLKKLSLRDCYKLGGYKLLGTMMDMLLENHRLEEINLSGTPLESNGDARYVHYELEKRKKMKVWELIKDMANVRPKSGRVFLCGNPRAGKTTLRMSMKELPELQKQQPSQLSITHRGRKMLRKKFGTCKVSKVCISKPEIDRTRGIEVDHVECDGIGISIWDMAGQTEYHSFHDLVIPNLSADGSCSLFLLTCNPMRGSSFEKRNISDIKTEVEYWLRFIASNTRRSWQYRPHVSIVMTHYDHWYNEVDFQSRIEEVVVDLKVQFEEVLEFDLKRKIFMVNGGEESCARIVFDFMKSHLKQLLARLPKTIKACSEVQRLIAKWNQELSKQVRGGQSSKIPMLKWEEFSHEICKGVEELQDKDKELARRKQEFVAISLNDGGHILYHEEGKFVITNPHWFCHDIMGEFLHRCANMDAKLEIVSAHGIISIQHVKWILMNIMGGQVDEDLSDATLNMMKKLHMCYEQDDKNIMIPSTLQDKKERLSWVTMRESIKLIHVGRRLSCKDGKRTMLSLGFFPRLQVSFFQKFQDNNVGNSYQIFQDVIMFICDGIEVIIEFDGVDMDIMLRSKVCQDKMLEFLENGIVRHIQDMLMNPTLGCAGVILVEHILRPKCVEVLVEMKDRKDQFVSMEELEYEVVTCGFDATHNWKQCGHLKVDYDVVKVLVGSKVWVKKFLEKRDMDLKRYLEQVLRMSRKNLKGDSFIRESGMDATWRSMVWQTLQKPMDVLMNRSNSLHEEMNVKLDIIDKKLDVVTRKVDDIHQMQENIVMMQENIEKMQDNLLREVSSRIDDLMELSIKMQRSKVPKLAYLSKVGHKKLLTCFVPGLVEFDLHLMCESRDGIHAVVGQGGCKVNLGTNGTRAFVTMLVWGLKVATIVTKIGAHVAGGMGGMVPDFGEGLQLAGLIIDTPGLMDEMSTLCLKSLPDNIRESHRITKDDRLEGEKWLVEVLEPKCKEESTFYQAFKLRKVVYKRVGSGEGSIAWLCDRCKKNGMQSGVLYDD